MDLVDLFIAQAITREGRCLIGPASGQHAGSPPCSGDQNINRQKLVVFTAQLRLLIPNLFSFFFPIFFLRCWRPSEEEVPKPRPGKVPKKVLRKVPARNGVPRKVPRKLLRVPPPVLLYSGAEPGALFSAPRFGPALSEALFIGPFPGRGFGTSSLEGRQDRNIFLFFSSIFSSFSENRHLREQNRHLSSQTGT